MYTTKVRDLTLCGMLSAVVAIGTMAISIPVPVTNGFINLGDGIILAAAFLLGGQYALIAGALGASIADILLGYAQWAPFTFFIKGLMGYVAVKLFERNKSPFSLRNLLTVLAVELIMILGYYFAGGILLSSFTVSLAEVPSNAVQAIGALLVYLVLSTGLLKAVRRG